MIKETDPGPTSLQEVLDQVEKVADDRERISIDMILESLGRRSFGPMLLVSGLVILAPLIGDIPGVPTIVALLVLLTTVQLLLRRQYFWMPHWLLKRSIDRNRLCKGLGWLRPAARFLDRFTKPRLTRLTRNAGNFVIAIVCILIAFAIPPMELVPFSANIAGIALTIFGLALTARDGLMALIALAVTFVGGGVALYYLP